MTADEFAHLLAAAVLLPVLRAHGARVHAGRAARRDLAGRSQALVFRKAACNFNPLCAMAGRVTIVQAEEVVEVGELDPDEIHLPGIFVQRVVEVGPGIEKPIEKRTVRTQPSTG